MIKSFCCRDTERLAAGHRVLRCLSFENHAMTRLDLIHPGEVLHHDFMEPFALSSTALARAIGVTPARINEIVRQQRGITADTALRLARYFGTDARAG